MTAKEAIMILESIQPSCGEKYSFSESEIYEAIDMAIEVLNCSEIPNKSAQPEQRWIPCSERLPEEGSYLVWMPFAPPEERIAVADYFDGYWNIKTPISAWMPLPEPYKGGDSE